MVKIKLLTYLTFNLNMLVDKIIIIIIFGQL